MDKYYQMIKIEPLDRKTNSYLVSNVEKPNNVGIVHIAKCIKDNARMALRKHCRTYRVYSIGFHREYNTWVTEWIVKQ